MHRVGFAVPQISAKEAGSASSPPPATPARDNVPNSCDSLQITYAAAHNRGRQHQILSALPNFRGLNSCHTFDTRKPLLKQQLLQAECTHAMEGEHRRIATPEELAASVMASASDMAPKMFNKSMSYLIRKARSESHHYATRNGSIFPIGGIAPSDIDWNGRAIRTQQGDIIFLFENLPENDIVQLKRDGYMLPMSGVDKKSNNLIGAGKESSIRIAKIISTSQANASADIGSYVAVRIALHDNDSRRRAAQNADAITRKLHETGQATGLYASAILPGIRNSAVLPMVESRIMVMRLAQCDLLTLLEYSFNFNVGNQWREFRRKLAIECFTEILSKHESVPDAIYHRDLKLENFLLFSDGQVKLTDFEGGACGAADFRVGQTEGYSDPNLKYKTYSITPEDEDTYSSGAILHMLFHGQPEPENANTSGQKVFEDDDDTLARLKEMPTSPENVARLMMQFDPNRRISIGEARDWLRQLGPSFEKGEILAHLERERSEASMRTGQKENEDA